MMSNNKYENKNPNIKVDSKHAGEVLCNRTKEATGSDSIYYNHNPYSCFT